MINEKFIIVIVDFDLRQRIRDRKMDKKKQKEIREGDENMEKR